MEILILVLLLTVLIIGVLYFGVVTVPQGEEWVVERLGKYARTLKPGLNFIIPFLEYVRAKLSTKDIIIDIDPQQMITKDNAVIIVDTIAFVKITDPVKAVYGVEDYKVAVEQLILTAIRAIIGEMLLDEALGNRDKIIARLQEKIATNTTAWGVTVRSVEIQDIQPSESMQKAMEQQAAAEREKRAIETKAEAEKKAMILEAEGRLKAAELDAKAQVALAESSAKSMMLISQGIADKELPAMFLLGEKYIKSLDNMAQSQNSKFVVYPADIQSTIKGMLGSVFKGSK
ncbi:MAG: SPFH/Band 7/PHB domain protein [Epsilonproteobacteria bacterium]|nr:SPFH/Band 7/PHB domain protein [Campylobacterota bacterium]